MAYKKVNKIPAKLRTFAPMQVAALDLGTNTFHMILANVERKCFRVHKRAKKVVHLGKEANREQWYISAAAEERACRALQGFASTLLCTQPAKILAVATAAFRADPHGKAVARRLERQTGIPIRIITGQEEAEFIYEGVRTILPTEGRVLLMDIGGGSVECIIGNARQAYWKASFPIGAQRLLHAFFRTDPMPINAQIAAQNYLRRVLSPLFIALQAYKPTQLLGISGTFTTLYAMYTAQTTTKKPVDNVLHLPTQSLRDVYRPLLRLPRTDRLQLPGMVKTRVDMLVTGSLIIDLLLQVYPFGENVQVASTALKEGLLQCLSKDISSCIPNQNRTT